MPLCFRCVQCHARAELWSYLVLFDLTSRFIFSLLPPQAMAYFEQLKESQDAWEVCADALAKGIYKYVFSEDLYQITHL